MKAGSRHYLAHFRFKHIIKSQQNTVVWQNALVCIFVLILEILQLAKLLRKQILDEWQIYKLKIYGSFKFLKEL